MLHSKIKTMATTERQPYKQRRLYRPLAVAGCAQPRQSLLVIDDSDSRSGSGAIDPAATGTNVCMLGRTLLVAASTCAFMGLLAVVASAAPAAMYTAMRCSPAACVAMARAGGVCGVKGGRGLAAEGPTASAAQDARSSDDDARAGRLLSGDVDLRRAAAHVRGAAPIAGCVPRRFTHTATVAAAHSRGGRCRCAAVAHRRTETHELHDRPRPTTPPRHRIMQRARGRPRGEAPLLTAVARRPPASRWCR